MFRPLRRNKQLLHEEETVAMLRSCTLGVLALQGDDGYPLRRPAELRSRGRQALLPLGGEGPQAGRPGAQREGLVGVIAADDIVPEKFTTQFRSAIVFGKARVVTDDAEKRHALMCLTEKYAADFVDTAATEIDGDWKRVSVIELAIEHMTGKASPELVKEGPLTP